MAADYPTRLDEKVGAFSEQLARRADVALAVYPSAASGYRMRCEFRIWHEGERSGYAMYEPGSKKLRGLSEFSPASPVIQKTMPALLAAVVADAHLRARLYAVEFLSTLSGELLITLIYHRRLDAAWEHAAAALGGALNAYVIGRSKKQRLVVSQDHVTEALNIAGRTYRYRQIEGGFSQPNARVNERMITWAGQQAEGIGGDLLELYCGNGNFTLPLARHFRRVLATEISKTSLAALAWSLAENGIDNIAYARLSAAEAREALDRVRPFRRLAHIDLDSYDFYTVLVDPPRAGVDRSTMQLLRRCDNVLYISCNPRTLFANLDELGESHGIEAAAAFDQFPLTPHLEAGIKLRRR
ncbi:MAG: tRNA (uridine(54)-C5)-methyltransferase TrmA [Gammaproteobacteria bacterium]|nr:tRNA (uridine(54)-C5)-methyltransferase TrmA [Gammaproteobacteria bacterium]